MRSLWSVNILTFFAYFCLILSEAKYYDECGSWKSADHVNVEVDRLVTGGYDIQGHLLHVCRSHRSPKIILPGKSRSDLGRCYTTYGGGESFTDKFEVLSEDVENSFQWVPYNGIIPDDAVPAGREYFVPVYVGKCTLTGTSVDGKTYKTELVGKIVYSPVDPKFVYVPFAGVEIKCRENMKILVCVDPEQIDSTEEAAVSVAKSKSNNRKQ